MKKKYYSILPLIFSVILLSGAIIFSPISLSKVALALNNVYNKSSGNPLTFDEWNFLDDDFLATDGSNSMVGNINMGNFSITNLAMPGAGDLNHAATVGYVNSIGSASANSRNGLPLNVVCDSTPQGATIWTDIGGGMISVYVDTTGSAGSNFSSTPIYITSIGGAGNVWDQYGGSIFSPTINGFDLEVRMFIGGAAHANTNQWYVNWCGIGN